MPFYTTRVIELVSSAARTATFAGSAYVVKDMLEGRIFVDVTAVSGSSPTLDITIQDSPDDGTTWFTHSTVSQITATGQSVISITNFGKTIRANCVIAGATPSFTFTIDIVGKG